MLFVHQAAINYELDNYIGLLLFSIVVVVIIVLLLSIEIMDHMAMLLFVCQEWIPPTKVTMFWLALQITSASSFTRVCYLLKT